MQTIVEILKKTEAYFAKAGLESPKIEAEWLLAGFLGCQRMALFLRWDEPLLDPQLEQLRELVKRRGKGEPLQYVLGFADFHEVRIPVGRGVLVPRPETEGLVEIAIKRLKEAAVKTPRIIDLGTGSGAIALAMARALPDARILAIDASQEALRMAREAAAALGLRERVAFRKGNWLEGITSVADAIIANPPYLTEAEWLSARPEVRDFEPREALVADDDGMADLKTILLTARDRLEGGGFVALEMGIDHGLPLREFASACGYRQVEVATDLLDRDRYLIAST